MIIADYTTEINVTDHATLEAFLYRRSSAGRNAFWLWNNDVKFPTLAILAQEKVAHLTYFQSKDSPGVRSMASDYDSTDGVTNFFVNNDDEPTPVPNDGIVSLTLAVAAAKQFFDSPDIVPTAFEWLQL